MRLEGSVEPGRRLIGSKCYSPVQPPGVAAVVSCKQSVAITSTRSGRRGGGAVTLSLLKPEAKLTANQLASQCQSSAVRWVQHETRRAGFAVLNRSA